MSNDVREKISGSEKKVAHTHTHTHTIADYEEKETKKLDHESAKTLAEKSQRVLRRLWGSD